MKRFWVGALGEGVNMGLFQWRKLCFGVVALVVFLYVLYGLSPVFDPDSAIASAVSSDEFNSAKRELSQRATYKGGSESYFKYEVSSLVSVIVHLRADPRFNDADIKYETPKVSLRYDNLTLVFGLMLVWALIFYTLFSNGSQQPDKVQRKLSSEAEVKSEVSKSSSNGYHVSAIDLFEDEVKLAEKKAEVLFTRSTLLLGGGIIMAFIGVVIFYLTLPEGTKEDTFQSFWIKALRPTGVLIFVEAIAWFLLRQYRTLVEDYKWFHRIYMKRANYLAALRVLDRAVVRPEDMFIAVSLIQEDLSGRISKDETTESLERLKASEDGPVTEILQAVTAFAKREPKTTKDKDDSAK